MVLLRLSLFLFLAGCSGYRFSQTSNPLGQYGVESLSIPMFYNYSSVPEVSSSFTRETYKLLSGFSGLRLKNGWSKKADAVLVGIIRSPEQLAVVLDSTNQRVAQSVAERNVGKARPQFYIPGGNSLRLTLQVVVIRRPSKEDLHLLQSQLGPQIPPGAKIIFNEKFQLSGNFTREVFDEEAGAIVATQNAGALRRAEDALGVQAAEMIRDMILYAF